jgi:RNA polymerase sigma-70 factor, ECF subfamily
MMVDAGALRSRCLEGEEPAWRELHAQYLPVAHAFLRNMGVPGPELDDACQEVFVQVFRYLARFEERAEFKTWLYKLCISQAGRVRRRAGIVAAIRRVLAPAGEEPRSDPHEWTESEAQRRVQAILAGLKEIHRVVFVLFEIEGLSGEEIGRITDLPLGTVRRRLTHAREAFIAQLGKGESRWP